MNRVLSVVRGLLTLLAAAICWHATAPLVLAQGTSSDAPGSSFIGSYAVVFLGAVLGMLLVCHGSHRSDRPRSSQFADD